MWRSDIVDMVHVYLVGCLYLDHSLFHLDCALLTSVLCDIIIDNYNCSYSLTVVIKSTIVMQFAFFYREKVKFHGAGYVHFDRSSLGKFACSYTVVKVKRIFF